MSELNVLKTDSDYLTLQFFLDLVRIQDEKISDGEKERGELLVSMAYNKEKAYLEVNVIQGRNLLMKDKVGKKGQHCNSYPHACMRR